MKEECKKGFTIANIWDCKRWKDNPRGCMGCPDFIWELGYKGPISASLQTSNNSQKSTVKETLE